MNYPIVFVPGLLGSMGDDIVPGTGSFSFGLAQYAYKPILDNLQEIGFTKGRDLFVSFYDWRKSNQFSAEKYLIPKIERVKKTTGSRKVNLVCHSMGGLIARYYIQSSLYKYDVDNLIMIGTPNTGAVKAYYFWEGGQIPINDGFSNLFYNLLFEGFIWLHKLFSGLDDDLTIKRELIPSVKELLPSRDYGDFLFTINRNNYGEFISQDKMIEQNTFLNNLNDNVNQIYRKRVKVHLISGQGVKTEKFIRVKNNTSKSSEWVDGIPDYVVYTNRGDGTVTCDSATAIYGKVTYVEGDHLEILKNSKEALRRAFNSRAFTRRIRRKNKEGNRLCTILVRNAKAIYIESRGRKLDIQKLTSRNLENITVNNIGKSICCITINLEGIKNTKLIFVPIDNAVSNILVLKQSDDNKLNERKEIHTEEVFKLDI